MFTVSWRFACVVVWVTVASAAADGILSTADGGKRAGALRIEGDAVVVAEAGQPELRVPLAEVAEAAFDLPAPAAGTGLRGEYFDGLEFGPRLMARVDPLLKFNWNKEPPHPSMPRYTYTVRWTGFLEVPQSASWRFETEADDGVRLWIGDRLVLQNWTTRRVSTDKGNVDLEAGRRHAIKLEFFQGQGDAEIRLFWNGPGVGREIVPAKWLSLPGSWPEGVTTRAGSFLAGRVTLAAGGGASVVREGGALAVPREALARIPFLELTEGDVAAIPPGATGVLLRTGDFVEGEVREINGGTVTLVSRLFGVRHFDGGAEVLAVAFPPPAPPPSAVPEAPAAIPLPQSAIRNPLWELRAADGSVLRASAVRGESGGVVVEEPLLGPVRLSPATITRLTRRAEK